MSKIPTTTLAGKQVGRMGFGLMQLTWTPEPPTQEESFAAMKTAADAGATAWSTATFYGVPGKQTDNLKLIGAFFKKYPEYKDKIVIVLKGGVDEQIHPVHDIEKLRKELKTATELMGKAPEIYSYARLPPGAPVEEVFQNLKTLKEEGLFVEVGASELSAKTLEKAASIVPIALNEIEVSLWSYESDIQAVIEYSKKTGTHVFAYSPLGRGFITRKWKTPDDIPEGSFQKILPRFQGEAFYDNLKLVDTLDEMAAKKGLKTAQLALAWVVGLGDYIIPIPGSSNPERARQNIEAASITLTSEDEKEIDEILAKFPMQGGRYPEAMSGVLMQ